MMRYLLALLLLPTMLYADSLRVECSADGFIANVTAARTTGSFVIQGGSGVDAMCSITDNDTTSNNGTGTTHRIGMFNGSEYRILYRCPTLPDSMRAYASGKTIQWDSAVIVLNVTAVPDSSSTVRDSLTISMFELRSTRLFVEANASYINYAISSHWTTNGASSTVSDIDNTNSFTSGWITRPSTFVGRDLYFTLNSAAITDTINNNAGAWVEFGGAVALASNILELAISFNVGEPLEIGVGPNAGAVTRVAVSNQGEGPTKLGCTLLSGQFVWIRSLSTTAVTSGYLTMNLLG